MNLRTIAAATLLALVVSACGPSGTPDAQVRAVIARGEGAAEARDISGVMDLVSPTFQDGRGGSRDDLKQYLRGYFVTHQSIHLLMRVDSVEFPYSDMAKVSLTLGTLGRETAGASAFDLAADVHEVELELQLEDGEWRVTRASWQSTSG
ncbi:MAG: hypothetical protein MUO39_13530 [Steroidobacteraceae bacterium]|nr:hypothetical protein [Steroidobacteraceae bacterium]